MFSSTAIPPLFNKEGILKITFRCGSLGSKSYIVTWYNSREDMKEDEVNERELIFKIIRTIFSIDKSYTTEMCLLYSTTNKELRAVLNYMLQYGVSDITIKIERTGFKFYSKLLSWELAKQGEAKWGEEGKDIASPSDCEITRLNARDI